MIERCMYMYDAGEIGGLTSLSWHPTIKQRLICSTDNQYIEDISLRESVPIAFAADNALTFASNETLYLGITNGTVTTATATTGGNVQSTRILASSDVIPYTGNLSFEPHNSDIHLQYNNNIQCND
jgi:hypothetical protein